VTELQESIHALAEGTNIKNVPAYSKIPEKDLMEILLRNHEAAKQLLDTDEIFFVIDGSKKKYNKDFAISKESIENILTKDAVEKIELLELGVKKPDYIGNSMWEFIHNNKIIEATMLHESWLREFRDRKVTLKPGDSLLAEVKTTIFFNHRSEEIRRSYSVVRVEKIIIQPFPAKNGDLELNIDEG